MQCGGWYEAAAWAAAQGEVYPPRCSDADADGDAAYTQLCARYARGGAHVRALCFAWCGPTTCL